MMKKSLLLFLLPAFLFSQIKPDEIFCNRAKTVNRILTSSKKVTENQEKIDMVYYRLVITLHPDTKTIQGLVTARGIVIDSLFTSLDLDLTSSLNVNTVTMGGETVSYNHANNLLTIIPPGAVSPGDTIEAVIDYEGTPPGSGFGSFAFDSYNDKTLIWTLSEPYGARDWWPCKDDPNDKADSVDLVITVPTGLIVASNGTLIGSKKVNIGQMVYSWHESYPITTYLVSLAIYPYQVWYDEYVSANNDTMPLTYYVFPDHYNAVRTNYLKTKTMIATYAALFGEYPFINEKYGHAEFGWGGGMEHQTLSSLGGASEGLIAHELAHQWWGDMVTCASFHHIWLNEGFATYSAALWQEAKYGKSAYHNLMRSLAYYGPGTIYVETPERVETIFNYNLSYKKASWVLHMLRNVVGDSTFFQIFKAYGSDPDFRYGTATTEQFRDLCEAVSGKDLDSFFEQWIYQSYYPIYRFSYYQSNDSLFLTINQTSSGQVTFDMPIDIRITCTDTVINTVVRNNRNHQQYQLPLPPGENVVNVKLDPDNWILKQVSYMVDVDPSNPPLPLSFQLFPAYPNPFNARTSISYALPYPGPVDISIIDLAGRITKSFTLQNSAGYHKIIWDGKDQSGRPASSGVYFINATFNQINITEKVSLLR
ncbi:MAG: T9SS type A sorting domain-containing protein [FCB group bacterium]|nr:T9SS type A sorting domain-containing protein [FCB group bacterium]